MKTTTNRKISITVITILLLGAAILIPCTASASAQAISPLSCSAPASEAERAQCAALEAQILDATVLIYLTMSCGQHGAGSGQTLVVSHGAIVDSRTVLTHDHYSALDRSACTLAGLDVYSGHGERLAAIADPAQLDDLARQLRPDPNDSSDQARTLILPAPVLTAPALVIERYDGQPDAATLTGWGELAQIDWQTYPRRTYVQWVKPVTVEQRGRALALIVAKTVKLGASGGGVYRIEDGRIRHIGNVWATRLTEDSSVVALNQTGAVR